MEQGPLPPHERTWRHPSELAAEERAATRAQTPAPSTRWFALTTGTIGLLAVGFLILTVTPSPQDSPVAISATTSPAASGSTQDVPGTVRPAALIGRGPVTTRAADTPMALATPIGDGHMAVITQDAMAALDPGLVTVRFPSGRLGSGRPMKQAGDAWLIELQRNEPGHELASERPRPAEIVTVMSDPPVKIALAELATIDIDEGTPVLDDDGHLVGICGHRRSDGGVRLIEISPENDAATNADR